MIFIYPPFDIVSCGLHFVFLAFIREATLVTKEVKGDGLRKKTAKGKRARRANYPPPPRNLFCWEVNLKESCFSSSKHRVTSSYLPGQGLALPSLSYISFYWLSSASLSSVQVGSKQLKRALWFCALFEIVCKIWIVEEKVLVFQWCQLLENIRKHSK